MAQSFLNCGHHGVHLIFPSHVRLKDHASTAISLDLLENPLRGFPVLVIVDDDGGAALRKTLCRGRTDTAARPGDESDFSLERCVFSLLRHELKAQMATASSAAPFSYFAALFLKERNFIFTYGEL